MKTFDKVSDLQQALMQVDREKIGFVPTMGALHEGHLSLIKESKKNSDITVVSMFVNPPQFNDPEDLKRYPRTLEKDIELLKTVDCDLVFAPSVMEIYPEPDTRKFDFGYLESIMEGAKRPGHFNGVGQVVSRLFDIVQPHKSFFGMKDFQQVAIIKNMVKQLNCPVEIIPCPIIREESGLAKSSRNTLLDENHKKNAPHIYATLKKARTFVPDMKVEELKK
jgi:pantoate--beta-alanine ligase